MLKYKIIHILSSCLILIILFSFHHISGKEKFKRKLNINISDNKIKLYKIKNADLIFTIKELESFVTITGWASDGYRCSIGKIIKGNIKDAKVSLYLFHNSIRSKNLRKMKTSDILVFGFLKSKKGKIEYEGFKESNGTRWNLLYIRHIKK